MVSDSQFMSLDACLPTSHRPLPKSYMHLTRQYPNSQKKPADFPKTQSFGCLATPGLW